MVSNFFKHALKNLALVLFVVIAVGSISRAQSWTVSTLANFQFPFGAGILSGLVIDSSGNMYATGPNESSVSYGAIYKISSKGVITDLYDFTSATGSPSGALLTRDTAGNLYGTSAGPGFSIVFKVSALGKETTLHTFAGSTAFPLP